jgi:glycine C-acetyltransferase
MAKLTEILEVCDRYDAVVVCDDAHGSGTLGTHGRGLAEHLGLEGRVPVVVTTFSKTFGGIGGVLLGSREVVEHVKHYARSFLFSASLPVPIVAAASTIRTMLEEEGPALVAELHEKAGYMRRRLGELGFHLGMSDTHIMPVMCRDERKALFMHIALLESGVMMVPITYPGVKKGICSRRSCRCCGASRLIMVSSEARCSRTCPMPGLGVIIRMPPRCEENVAGSPFTRMTSA